MNRTAPLATPEPLETEPSSHRSPCGAGVLHGDFLYICICITYIIYIHTYIYTHTPDIHYILINIFMRFLIYRAPVCIHSASMSQKWGDSFRYFMFSERDHESATQTKPRFTSINGPQSDDFKPPGQKMLPNSGYRHLKTTATAWQMFKYGFARRNCYPSCYSSEVTILLFCEEVGTPFCEQTGGMG